MRGLTLIELACVVTIIGIGMAMAIPAYQRYQYRVQVSKAVLDIGALQAKIDNYYLDTHQYPAALTDVGFDPTVSLDPWGYQYQYLNHAGVNGKGSFRKDRSLNPLNADYDLYSVGIDGLTKMPITNKESQDDVIRAGNGAYIGLASGF